MAVVRRKRAVVVPDRHPWPVWKRLRTEDQNLSADIELARVDLANLAQRSYPEHERNILINCTGMLQKCIDTHRSFFFPNRIFIRQTLFAITQNVISITPRENLESIWINLKQRLTSIGATDQMYSLKSDLVKRIDKFFASKDGKGNGQEKSIRPLIRRVRSFLDERVLGDLLSGIALERQTARVAALAILCLSLLMLVILGEVEKLPAAASWFSWNSQPNPTVKHGILGMFLGGILGGAISTIWQPSLGAAISLPLVKVAVVRPLIGGVAGVFLYLVLRETNTVTIAYPGLYAAAIAIGFSEQVFARVLDTTAREIGADVNRGIGHASKAQKGDKSSQAPVTGRSRSRKGGA